MGKWAIRALLMAGGLLTGIAACWVYYTDACYDAGGYWERHGSYCYGARAAHPDAEFVHP